MTQASSTYQRWTRRLAMASALALVIALGVFGWRWQAALQLSSIDVVGATHTPPDSLRALARVDTGTVLFDVEPVLVADRVRRHPWVEDASVMRLPTGTLRIHVTERTPAALVMADDGAPAFYVDRHGFCMPLPERAGYDVPLLHGIADAYSPTRPIAHEPVRHMLDALPESDANRLIAEWIVHPDSTLWAYTRPTSAHDAIRVDMGRADFPQKLRRLHAFWTQAVQPRPDTHFARIDLRFDSQIVTEETASGIRSPLSAGPAAR